MDLITSSEILKNRLYRTRALVKDKRIHYEFERIDGYVNKVSLEALEMGACIYFCENSATPLSGFIFETEDVKRWEGVVPLIEQLFFFLTDRTIFIELKKKPSMKQLTLSKPERDGRDIMLFSGGCDSFCGALWALEEGREIALVHTMTSSAMLGKADYIHKKHFGTMDIPLYNVNSVFTDGALNRYYPQTRSAMFALNAVPVMECFQSSRLWIPENGPLMINPPISTMTISTRSTRPEALTLLREILSSYLDREITVDSPFKDLTKAEVVARFSDVESVLGTYSCFNYRWGRYRGMCGRCYGCNTTRLSLYALGIDDRRYHQDYSPFKETGLSRSKKRRDALFLFSDFIDTCCKLATRSELTDPMERSMNKAQQMLDIDVRDLMRRFALDQLLGIENFFSMQEISRRETLLGRRFDELMQPNLIEMIRAREDELRNVARRH